MRIFARLTYRILLWSERRRALRRAQMKPGASGRQTPTHLETGRRGETLAYWYLRQAGYTVVARNRRSRHRLGELDMVAYDGPVLAFIEVKARSSAVAGPPEAAVFGPKQKRIVKTAQEYLQRLGRGSVSYRFDIVSVLWMAESGCDVRLIKDAFKESGGFRR